jgi:hypothetical protein
MGKISGIIDDLGGKLVKEFGEKYGDDVVRNATRRFVSSNRGLMGRISKSGATDDIIKDVSSGLDDFIKKDKNAIMDSIGIGKVKSFGYSDNFVNSARKDFNEGVRLFNEDEVIKNTSRSIPTPANTSTFNASTEDIVRYRRQNPGVSVQDAKDALYSKQWEEAEENVLQGYDAGYNSAPTRMREAQETATRQQQKEEQWITDHANNPQQRARTTEEQNQLKDQIRQRLDNVKENGPVSLYSSGPGQTMVPSSDMLNQYIDNGVPLTEHQQMIAKARAYQGQGMSFREAYKEASSYRTGEYSQPFSESRQAFEDELKSIQDIDPHFTRQQLINERIADSQADVVKRRAEQTQTRVNTKTDADIEAEYNRMKNEGGYTYLDDTGASQAAAANEGPTGGSSNGPTNDAVKQAEEIKKTQTKYSGGSFSDALKNGQLGEWSSYNRIPQKAVGIGATAYLVSRMANKKGQQSNAELYGQASPYGG